MGQRKLGISTADARDGLHFRGQKSRQHTPTRRGRKIGEKKKYGSGGRRNIGFDLEYGDGGYKDDQDWYTYVKLRYQLRQSWNSIHRRLTGRGCRSTMVV